MRSLRSCCVPLLVCAQSAAKPLSEYSLAALKKFVAVRGAECPGCASKEDYLARAEAVREWVVDEANKRAYEEAVTYRKKVKQFNMSRDDFLQQMNESEADHPLEGARAERLWQTYQEQVHCVLCSQCFKPMLQYWKLCFALSGS